MCCETLLPNSSEILSYSLLQNLYDALIYKISFLAPLSPELPGRCPVSPRERS